MPLHIDYRPESFDELLGNASLKTSLKSVFSRTNHPHVFLLYGSSGCGKTTIGRIIAKMLNCSEMDFQEYNSANTRGIDTIRTISENCHYAPTNGDVKVYLIDECHQVTKDAKEAFLKVLEDCPRHVYFILCTTEPDKLPKTIHTRCSSYQVEKLDEDEIKILVKSVLKKEGVKSFPDKVINEIVKLADGCPRQALVTLDQVIDIEDDDEAFKAVAVAIFGEAESLELCRGLMKHITWKEMKPLYNAVIKNTEPEKLRRAVLGYMNAVLKDERNFSKPSDYIKASSLIKLFSQNTFDSGEALLTDMFFDACN